jgi:hypothetical protein
MADGGASLQTETAMSGQQGVTGRFGAHPAIAKDELGEHSKDRPASGALNAPNGETAQANTSIMGVASQGAAAVTGRFVGELKPEREDEGEHELNERLAIAKELQVGGLIVEIDGEGAVLTGRFVGLGHV